MKSLKWLVCGVILGLSVFVACSDDAADSAGSLSSSQVLSSANTSSLASSSQLAGSSSSSATSSSSASFGPLESALVELFEDGVPPTGWTKLGIYSEHDTGYSCGTNGQVDTGYGVKFSGSGDNTSWIMTGDISALNAVAVTFWYCGGAAYTGANLGLKTEVSTDGASFSTIGTQTTATAQFAKAGPYEIPAGTKHIRIWYLKHASYNVTIDAFVLWRNK